MDERIPAAPRRTYEAIFAEPPPTDLDWGQVRTLLTAIAKGAAKSLPNGARRFERQGRIFLFQPELHRGLLTASQVKDVRRFLEGPTTESAAGEAEGAHLMVVLGAVDGRVYRLLPSEGEPTSIENYDPRGAGRALYYMQDRPEADADPHRETFHEAIARALRGARRVLVIGRGAGSAGAAGRLVRYLQASHPTIGRFVKSAVQVPEAATVDQLLKKARAMHEGGEDAEPVPEPRASGRRAAQPAGD